MNLEITSATYRAVRDRLGPKTPRSTSKDDGAEPALADGLHLSQGDRLGLVLSQYGPGRLLALYHRLEAMHDDEGAGRDFAQHDRRKTKDRPAAVLSKFD